MIKSLVRSGLEDTVKMTANEGRNKVGGWRVVVM